MGKLQKLQQLLFRFPITYTDPPPPRLVIKLIKMKQQTHVITNDEIKPTHRMKLGYMHTDRGSQPRSVNYEKYSVEFS